MAALTTAVMALTAIAFTSTPALAAVTADSDLVIAEVYGGGGNSGAAYNRDFIEIANVSESDLDLAGYTVQYASATGTSWQTTALTGIIPAGERMLVGEACRCRRHPPILHGRHRRIARTQRVSGKSCAGRERHRVDGVDRLGRPPRGRRLRRVGRCDLLRGQRRRPGHVERDQRRTLG